MEDSEGKENKERTDITLAQWQTCVEMANAASQRRDVMNGLFVTVNLALVAAVSIVWDVKAVCISVAGFCICFVWLIFIISYRKLNTAKYEVINKLEESLPYAPFTEEWKALKEGKKNRRFSKSTQKSELNQCSDSPKSKKSHYIEQTWIEGILSGVFMAGYIIMPVIISIYGG
ncbi:MAG: hypothetical protein LUD50_06535 [Clostridia bacterium]|nr:hypothetical protein [Clostridia bacterium]